MEMTTAQKKRWAESWLNAPRRRAGCKKAKAVARAYFQAIIDECNAKQKAQRLDELYAEYEVGLDG